MADAELVVHFDLDRQTGTGCAATTSEGPVPGIELRLRALVDLDTALVHDSSHASCIDPEEPEFGAETPLAAGWNAVPGDGGSGSTLIELRLPLSAAPFATTADAYVALTAPAGGDALLGPSAVLLRSAPIPLELAWLAPLLGVALLAALRGRARRLAPFLCAALAAGPVLVHAALGEGSLRVWSESERVATDARGDSPEGADLLALFAFVDAAQEALLLRVDALLGPPICLAWPTVDPGSGYPCSQEPPADAPSGKRFALTFDDGPNLAVTPGIVAILRAENVPATFFMQGNRLGTEAARALAREIHEDPLLRVANHTWSHPHLPALSVDAMRAEITNTTDVLRSALADSCWFPRFFRFPYSDADCTSMAVVREQGLSATGVHLDALDWCYGIGGGTCAADMLPWLPDVWRDDMVGWVLMRAQQTQGGIVLMHDTWPHTVEQLPAIIAGLRAQGGSFVALDDVSAFPALNEAVNAPEPPACCDGAIR